MVTLQPKKSGDTIEDVIEYVRVQMYKDTHKSGSSDEESESEEAEPSVIVNKEEEDGDGKNDESKADDSDNEDNEESNSEDDDDEKSVDVPKNYFFPSFFVFVAHGPFVPPDERLEIFLLDNKDKKKGEGTRAQLRKKDAEEKSLDARHDTAAKRGFPTEQCLDIEALDLQKQAMLDRKHDSVLVGLSVEENALTKQIEAAERRAMSRCKEYDANNVYWKKVDILLTDQDKLLLKIRKFNEQMMSEEAIPRQSVSSLVNTPSPKKSKSSKNSVEEIVDGDHSESSSVVSADDNLKESNNVSNIEHNN